MLPFPAPGPALPQQRHGAILLSSLAGGDGLQVLLDQAALVVAGVRQPDLLHVLAEEGHDGKSLVCVDHLKQVFGTAYGNAPSSMLQTDREFQVQGLNFVHYSFLCFDESKRDQSYGGDPEAFCVRRMSGAATESRHPDQVRLLAVRRKSMGHAVLVWSFLRRIGKPRRRRRGF